MERKITIKILDRQFSLKAKSPEEEAEIRKAAEKVDEKYRQFLISFPGKNSSDILSFIALNSILETERLNKLLRQRQKEEQKLYEELESYLNDVDKI